MSNEEAIFNQATRLPKGDERVRFLGSACHGDPDLRERIESLLLSHDDTSFILNRADDAAGLLIDDSIERAGTKLGNFKLLQKIGEGGMGIVFMAEQSEPVRRKVAIKIIKPGMDSRQVIHRFEAERQALALMDHPNITRVLDAGVTASGRSYFVMDLVRGSAITEYCDKNKISIQQRLELFYQVCSAIHHAHQRGIIHRDIKPNNVMITMHDGVAVPKVIDFGIAKALDRPLTEKTLFTQYGELIGTPEYMSPEQAEMSGLDLDVRCDVYSLGVLLFELLAGSTPLQLEPIKEQGLLKVFETIRDCETEPASTRITQSGQQLDLIAKNRKSDPTSLTRLIRGELDWIVAKSLAKDRERRYESVATFANDIQRYLRNEPIEAAAPTLRYKAGRFYRRYKLPCIFAASLAVVLVLSTGISFYFAVDSMRANRISKKQLVELAAEKRLSDQRRIEAEQALTRAEKAEAEARKLGMQRQNDAAVSRGMSRYLMERMPKDARRLLDQAIENGPTGLGRGVKLAESGKVSGSIVKGGSFLPGEVLVPFDPKNQGINRFPQESAKMTNNALSGRAVTINESPEFFSKMLQCILEEQRKEFGSTGEYVANTLFRLGKARMKLEQFERAELRFRESLEIVDKMTDLNDKETKDRIRQEILPPLVECLKAQEKTSQAAEYEKQIDRTEQ